LAEKYQLSCEIFNDIMLTHYELDYKIALQRHYQQNCGRYFGIFNKYAAFFVEPDEI